MNKPLPRSHKRPIGILSNEPSLWSSLVLERGFPDQLDYHSVRPMLESLESDEDVLLLLELSEEEPSEEASD